MSTWDALQGLLATDARDVGCADTFALIHAYAEVAVRGEDPEQEMPGITAHLASCGPCADDYLGLLAVLRAEADGTTPPEPRRP